MDIKGYAKLDFRLCEKNFYLIEINAQVSFHPRGEFITCAHKDGYSFEEVINHIVDVSLKTKRKVNSTGVADTYENQYNR